MWKDFGVLLTNSRPLCDLPIRGRHDIPRKRCGPIPDIAPAWRDADTGTMGAKR
jgi:hypothetical protein